MVFLWYNKIVIFMATKLCKKCNEEKEETNFRYKKKGNKFYLYSYCKECEKKYAINNRDKKRLVDKKYRDNHKEEIKRRRNSKLYYQEYKEKMKLYMSFYVPQWRKKNKDKIKQYIAKERIKIKNNELLYFKHRIRKQIARSFKCKGYYKKYHTDEIVGIPLKDLFVYLKKTYKDNYGYEWDGKELVHIDHIIPLSTATTEEEIINLCYYTNLQLLKAKDNLQKSNKLEWKLEK